MVGDHALTPLGQGSQQESGKSYSGDLGLGRQTAREHAQAWGSSQQKGMRHGTLIFLVLLGLSFSILAQEYETNNCQDPAAWTDWQERVSQHPNDQELQLLHALWTGLCIKVDTGEVPFAEISVLFKRAREALI